MKSSIRKGVSLVLLLSMAMFLSGCAYKRTLDDISAVNPSNEVIFVGRIEIDPKIEKEDVTLKRVIGGGDLYRTFVMHTGEDISETGNYTSDMAHSAMVYTDEDFYLSFDRNEVFKMFGGYFYTEMTGGSTSTVFFHIRDGMEARYSKNANAVYIGTIRFKRDEFFNLKDVNFSQDGFEAAQKRFQKKFKTKTQLVKAKISKAKE